MRKIVLLMTLFFSTSTVVGATPIDTDGARCDKKFGLDRLSADENALLNKGEPVAKFLPQKHTIKSADGRTEVVEGFEMGYILSYSEYEPALVMGTFASCNEHAGKNGLGEFIVASKILNDGTHSPYRIMYEQQVDLYPNVKYVYENTAVTVPHENGDEYLLDSHLVSSIDNTFSPRWAEAYVRVIPAGKGSLVIACTYMVPREGRGWPLKGIFIDNSRNRLKSTGVNLNKWVRRVSQDRDETAKKLELFEKLFRPN